MNPAFSGEKLTKVDFLIKFGVWIVERETGRLFVEIVGKKGR